MFAKGITQIALKKLLKSILPKKVINLRRKIQAKSILAKQVSSVSMSQAGQDYWVYGEVFNEKCNGYFLDIGANDGVYMSNTFLLEKRYGWNGICIEADPAIFKELKNNRSSNCVHACIDSHEKEVSFAMRGIFGGIVAEDCNNTTGESSVFTLRTSALIEVLDQNNAPCVIDYMSIDIEGAEDRALLQFPFSKYQFNCMTIERPTTQLKEVLKCNSYILIKEVPDHDSFYVHEGFRDQYMNNLFSFSNKKYTINRWQ